MSTYTLGDALNAIQSVIAQDPTLPTGADLNTQINMVNQSLVEWGNSYQWKQLRFTSTLTFAYSGLSIALPFTFKKLMSPLLDMSKSVPDPYYEIFPWERYGKLSSDKYVVIGGNNVDGKYMIFNPAMASGLSLQYDWQAFPSSVVTNQDVIIVPDPQFIVNRVLSKILFARADPRFQPIAQDANDRLQNMIEEEAVQSLGQDNTTRNNYYVNKGFRIGDQ